MDITIPACSCTGSYYYYWSSATYQPSPSNAWLVSFYDGTVTYNAKSYDYHVRAVRGGS